MESTATGSRNISDAPPENSASTPEGTEQSPYRWVILLVVWMSFLLSCVSRAAWSTVSAPVGHSLGISVAMLGAFVTAFYVGYVVANVGGGFLTDVIGGRRTLTYTLILLGISTFAFGYANDLRTGFAIQTIMGLAAGADYPTGVKIITSWFGKDRGRALGLYTTATSFAVVIANATIPLLSNAFGWQNAFRALGLCTFGWAFVSSRALRDAPTKAAFAHITTDEIRALVKNRNLVLLALAGLGALWATVGFTAWGNALMIKQYEIDPVTAGRIFVLFGVGAVLTKPLLGWLSDLFDGATKLLGVLSLACFAGMLLVFSRCSTAQEFYIAAPFLGAVAFGYTPVLVAQVTQTSGAKAAGLAAGLTTAVWQLGSAMAPLVVGAVYARSHSFSYPLLTLAAGPVLGALILIFIRRRSSNVAAVSA
ncbi:MFS transporter [Burkholderia sp. Bp8992]|uniref:MFS transporter n=1 Tax=Burkholderia sp. Bp8992 TaxID=2184554 RepID=UPI000F56D9AE|nr:MFS transporter [Burkholderia sp. Bp8992]